MLKRIALLIVLAASGTAVEADSFVCGQWIISEDLSPADIKKKCGAPDSMTSETADVRGPGAIKDAAIKYGTTTIERWTYRRGAGAAPMVVTIVDGKVKSILLAN